jgi:phosphoribosylanthranilate isomerase
MTDSTGPIGAEATGMMTGIGTDTGATATNASTVGATTAGTTGTKICGLTNEADLAAAVDAGADAVGFVVGVSVDSPREIAPERARELVAAVPPSVSSVVVTMADAADATERAVSLVEEANPDALQVHAASPEEVASIRVAITVPVIAAIDARADSAEFSEAADALLVDSLDAAGAGGTGETGDWERAREIVAESTVPVILAGGLDPENLSRAVERAQPFAVDVASGVEKHGGVKDHDAVRAFVARATAMRPGAAVRS